MIARTLRDEQRGQALYAYEFKWSAKKQPRLSKTFLDAYDAEGQVVNRENFRSFVAAQAT